MNLNDHQTGQSTPLKTHARITQCSQVIANMRAVMAKANAKATEKNRINKSLVTHHLAISKVRKAGGAKQVWQDMSTRHQDTTYHALAYSMPMQSQLQAGI